MKHRKKYFSYGKQFYILLGTNIALIIIPLLAATLISLQILHVSEDQIQDSLINSLRAQLLYMQTASPARQRSVQLTQLKTDPALYELQSNKEMPDSVNKSEMERQIESLQGLVVNSTGNSSVYLYFTESDYLMGPIPGTGNQKQTANPHIWEFWDLVDRSDTSFSRTLYGQDLLKGYYWTVSIAYVTDKTYFISLHTYQSEEGPTLFLSDEFLKSFDELELAYYDSYGNNHPATENSSISSIFTYESLGDDDISSFQFTHNRHSYIACAVTNRDSHTKIALFCRNTLRESRQTMRLLLIVSSAALLFLCIISAFFTLRRSYSPISTLIQEWAGTDQNRGMQDDIGLLSDTLQSQHSRLLEKDMQLTQRNQLLTQNYILRYLHGLDTTQLADYRPAWLDSDSSNYRIVLIRDENNTSSENNDLLPITLKDYFQNQQINNYIIPGDGLYCVIIKTPDSLTDTVIRLIFQLYKEKWTNSELSISVSNSYTNASELPKAFKEATDADAYCRKLEQYGIIFFYYDIPQNSEDTKTNTTDFARLDRLTKNINEFSDEQALDDYDILIGQMTSSLGHTPRKTDTAFTLLANTIALAFYNLDIPGDIGKKHVQKHMDMIFQSEDAIELRTVLQNSLNEFFQGNQESSVEENSFRCILSYVQTNISDPNLCSSQVADTFHMSSSNLTRLFKKYNHTGFLEYVHHLRVEKACLLLKDSSRNISDIAQLVGYSNTITMNRAFKSYLNITPSAYRQKNKPE